MKRTSLILLITLTALCTWGENLLLNPGFEKIRSNGHPENWKPSQTKVFKTVSEGENHFLQIRTRPLHKQNRGGAIQILPDLKPGKYSLSGKLKGNFSKILSVFFLSQNAVPKIICLDKTAAQLPKDKNGWQSFSWKVTVPASHQGLGQLVLEVWTDAPETDIFFDDISLELLEAAKAPAADAKKKVTAARQP